MTSISLLNPYAPQPAAVHGLDGSFGATQTTQPMTKSSSGDGPGTSSDQSGSGAGNGTGTGGSDRQAAQQARERASVVPSKATSKSVVDAQAHAAHVEKMRTEVHDRTQQARAKDDEVQRKRDEDADQTRMAERREHLRQSEDEAAEARAAARLAEEKTKARKAQFPMPDPIPTAPILQRDVV